VVDVRGRPLARVTSGLLAAAGRERGGCQQDG
jgi:hypothetical protein